MACFGTVFEVDSERCEEAQQLEYIWLETQQPLQRGDPVPDAGNDMVFAGVGPMVQVTGGAGDKYPDPTKAVSSGIHVRPKSGGPSKLIRNEQLEEYGIEMRF